MLRHTVEDKIASFGGGFLPLSRRVSAPPAVMDRSDGFDAEADAGPVSPGAAGGDNAAVPVRVVVRSRPLTTLAGEKAAIFAEPVVKDKCTLRVEGMGEGALDKRTGRGVAPRMFKCNAYLGPEADQSDVFEQAAPIVERTLQGYNGTIFCYGCTGSGKTYTMSGPPEKTGKKGAAQVDLGDAAGIAQRVSRRVFECIRDGGAGGDSATSPSVFAVEASFLEIYSMDGKREQLIDLLASDDKVKLEVKRDPSNPNSFICDGLSSIPIRSPDEMCEALYRGRQHCMKMETTKNCWSSRSHCLFMLSIESTAEKEATDAGGEPVVRRGKLILVDLAGSESIKKVQAANDVNEDLRKQQAIGINRVLSSLATCVNALNNGFSQGHRDSYLTMLLHDCLGGNSRALLVANITPEIDNVGETMKTLLFAQQMMMVKNVASVNVVSKDKSAILAMRQRHADCLRLLEEEATKGNEEQAQGHVAVRKEIEDLNMRLLTKESAESTLGKMQKEQTQRLDLLRDEMRLSMTQELEKMRMQSVGDLKDLRESVQSHVTNIGSTVSQRHNDEHEAKMAKMAAEQQETVRLQREAEQEAAQLRVRLASSEERATMLQARQDELRLERGEVENERKTLRQTGEQQWQRVVAAEAEVQMLKAETKTQQAELERLATDSEKNNAAARQEREEARLREVHLQSVNVELKGSLGDARRDAEVQLLRAEAAASDQAGKQSLQVERLQTEVAAANEQVRQVHAEREKAENAAAAVQQEHEMSVRQLSAELQERDRILADTMEERDELLHMVHEMQSRVIAKNAFKSAG